MQIITAPEPLKIKSKSIFLAGSIEQDKAARWQDEVIGKLKQYNYTILNPRRKKWDASWEQRIDDPNFKERVNWELDALEKADVILMYFDPRTKSPISLLELGLFAKSGKLVVCCPEGFWRKGNVDIVCDRFGVEQVEDLEDAIFSMKNKLA
ncbi:MAG: nucleoside 2-deoxyribosyltransferase domain-containing protein [Saprospiraceae bacterium]